jgi:hypothetical protein
VRNGVLSRVFTSIAPGADMLPPLISPLGVPSTPHEASNSAAETSKVPPALSGPAGAPAPAAPPSVQPLPQHPAQAVIGDLALLEPTSRKNAARGLPTPWAPRVPGEQSPPLRALPVPPVAGLQAQRAPEAPLVVPQLVVWDLAEGGRGTTRPASGNRGTAGGLIERDGAAKKAVVTRPGAEVLLGEMREHLNLLRSMLPSGPLVPPGVTAKSLREGDGSPKPWLAKSLSGGREGWREGAEGTQQPVLT